MPATTRPDDLTPLIEESIDIDAPPATVWGLVADLRNMARWSPQVVKTIVRGPVQKGTRAFNINRRGPLFWPTRTKVVRFEPDRVLAFRVKDNMAIWSFELSPIDDGRTRVVQRREMPDGTTSISHTLVKRVMGGQPSFSAELKRGMASTLAGIKRDAEARRSS